MKLSGVEVLDGGSFDEGTGRIWLDSVQCTGSERKLINCVTSSSVPYTCSHTQDVGVQCSSGKWCVT